MIVVNYPTGQRGLKKNYRVLYIVCQEKKTLYIVFSHIGRWNTYKSKLDVSDGSSIQNHKRKAYRNVAADLTSHSGSQSNIS